MSSIARPALAPVDVVLKALSGQYGPFGAAAVSLAGLFSFLCLYFGAPITYAFFTDPLAIVHSALHGKLHAIFLAHLALTGGVVLVAVWWATKGASPRRLAVRAIGGIAVAIWIGSIPTGSVFWLASAYGRHVLFVGLAQVIVLFSIVWSCRSLQYLIFETFNRRLLPWKGTAYGALGSTLAIAIAGTVAAARGLDLSRLDGVHRFYVLAVPAIAGFGWTAPWPRRRSFLVATILAISTLLIAIYCLPMPFVERGRIRCDYPYERPRHSAFGFELEPWHWESPYDPASWILAPGALAELTVRYITHPLVGTCPAT